ncbi:hypothetical protein PP304_gp027 [Gordonia phage Phendrix]|uniref:Uncharacterized protein n=1 Tax=Gordonia phage Phendrix TaxID=2593335 RepID=A0A514U0W1_9CAUD|nr:hypothetical protein PP304_gp027 [Gordonia phage Phendrix]QDK02575.1 hypothetical protein SEA_PHENDRIX_27 [Gordonia phage Phendrix]
MITTLFNTVKVLHSGRVFEYPVETVTGAQMRRYTAKCRCGWESAPVTTASSAKQRAHRHMITVWEQRTQVEMR